jgi:opacity protein-like surface antigen
MVPLTKEAHHMQKSLIVAIAAAVGLGASSIAALLPSAHADGLVVEGKEAMKGTGKSLTEATGKLKTDATQTKEDAKKLDIDKTKQGVGQVKEDVKGVKEGAKGALTNPLGK